MKSILLSAVGMFMAMFVIAKPAVPKPLKIGYSAAINEITPQKMAYAKSVGIDFIELSLKGFIDNNRNFNFNDAEIIRQVKAAKKTLNESGIKVWSIHIPYGKNIDISLPDESEREKVIALHKKVLKHLEILEPQIILFHPSWYLGLNERELRKTQMIKSATELNKEVRKIKATMVIENMLGPELKVDAQRERPLCRTVEETVEIMNRLPGNIYSAIDMNHIKHPEKLIRAMGKRLKSIHVADGNGKQENHYFPCSDKGENDWTEILTALNEVGYKGPCMYECAFNDVKELKDCYETLYNRTFISKISQKAYSATKDSILSAKIFPLLSAVKNKVRLNQAPTTAKRILDSVQSVQSNRVQKALQNCKTASCYADSTKWTEKEINRIGDALIGFYQHDNQFKETIAQLKKDGSYALFESLPDTALLRNAWNQSAKGINRIFDIYIKGERPRYYKIDSISYKRGDTGYKQLVNKALADYANNSTNFFDLSLNTAIKTLRLNGRDEAARFVPLNDGMNAEPFSKIKTTNWDKYKYSAILIPGLGPEEEGVKLDSGAIVRCKSGVERFRKGLAPFIIVSGGNVHPFQTPYNEAVEMKKYLVEQLNIPEDVVFIEPDARHTTTNLRNASRMIYHFGIPSDKPVLIVTDKSQSSYINSGMAKSSMRDLGYLPYKNLKKISETETEFHPNWNSMQVDPFDPLDP